MKTTNNHIYEVYLKGYEDESFGTSTVVGGDPLLIFAYELGVSHVLPNRKYNVLEKEFVIEIVRKQKK